MYFALGTQRNVSQLHRHWLSTAQSEAEVPSLSTLKHWAAKDKWTAAAKKYDEETAISTMENTQEVEVKRRVTMLNGLHGIAQMTLGKVTKLIEDEQWEKMHTINSLTENLRKYLGMHEALRDTSFAKMDADITDVDEVTVERIEKFTYLKNKRSPLLLEAQVIDDE